MNHTFAICAYGESPYLAACVESVAAQAEGSQVILCTSTPNSLIEETARRFGLPLLVNDAPSSISGDWNFAMAQARGAYVTLCHQDDLYEPGYRQAVAQAVETGGFDIFFTDYQELRNGVRCGKSRLLTVKRLLLAPLRLKALQGSAWAKRFALRFGNGICCPSVTYHKEALTLPLFESGLKSNLDWQTWERLSRGSERFCYVPQRLMCHRIHAGSETSRVIGEGRRGGEDYQMFLKFWPPLIARWLTRLYSASEKGNEEARH